MTRSYGLTQIMSPRNKNSFNSYLAKNTSNFINWPHKPWNTPRPIRIPNLLSWFLTKFSQVKGQTSTASFFNFKKSPTYTQDSLYFVGTRKKESIIRTLLSIHFKMMFMKLKKLLKTSVSIYLKIQWVRINQSWYWRQTKNLKANSKFRH